MILLEDPPSLSSEQEDVLQNSRQRIEEDPNLWDGPMLFSLGEGRAFQATYAWNDSRLPGRSMVVALLLRGSEGWLWQQRSSTVEFPGMWDFSAAGALESPNIEEEMRREALEEIGQSDLQNLSLLRRVEDENAFFFLWRADWSGEEIVLNDEVASWTWAPQIPSPALPWSQRVSELVTRNAS